MLEIGVIQMVSYQGSVQPAVSIIVCLHKLPLRTRRDDDVVGLHRGQFGYYHQFFHITSSPTIPPEVVIYL